MAKKKKMTKAQAAAARKELSSHDRARAQIREKNKEIRETQQRIQKEQGKSSRLLIVVGCILVLAIFVLAFIITVGPGMLIK